VGRLTIALRIDGDRADVGVVADIAADRADRARTRQGAAAKPTPLPAPATEPAPAAPYASPPLLPLWLTLLEVVSLIVLSCSSAKPNLEPNPVLSGPPTTTPSPPPALAG